MIVSHQRGHEILYINNQWLYRDNLTPIYIERPCKLCGNMPTKKGHDWCMRNSKGKSSVCCGHGVSEEIII